MPDAPLFTESRERARPEWSRRFVLLGAVAAVALALVIFLAYALFVPVRGFPTGSLFNIPEGATILSLSDDLKSAGLVRSAPLFEKLVIVLGKERGVIAGDYYFQKPLSLYGIARRVTTGAHGLVPIRMTIPEGYTSRDIANAFDGKFHNFDPIEFHTLVQGKEGYLFPDTYFFMPNVRADDVVALLTDNFEVKIRDLEAQFASTTRTLHEILTIASMLEEEAGTTQDRRMIAGIIERRLKLGMPLQIDAALSYVVGRNTYELTVDDLAMDSPYNTYKFKGLPPGPISNPGLDSIGAALDPIPSKYLYYLSDKEGKVYYAVDFEGHKKNRELYMDE